VLGGARAATDDDGVIDGIVVTLIDITFRKRAEDEIRQRAEELRSSNEELARFTGASVGRELRMIELKREVNELCLQAGLSPRYPLDFRLLVEGSIGEPAGIVAPPRRPAR